jgi:protein ImuB
MIAALDFGPLALYLAERADPGSKRSPLVVVEEQRVAHANAPARRHGITPGMRLDGARMRVEGLQVASYPEPDLDYAWQALLRELHGITPWLESGPRGRAFARIDAGEAAELATRYDVRVGLADDCETAELAALAAHPGRCREVHADQRDAFLERLPLRFLKGVGVSDGNLVRLHWLGLTTVAELARWSAVQLRSYLGGEGEALLPYLHGPRRATLRPFQLPRTLRRSLAFPEPVREPYQLLPAIDRLAGELERALAGRASRRLTLTTTLSGGQRRATRLAKRPLQQARHIRQQALFALRDSHVDGRFVERLTLELASPERLGMQEGLWPQRERRQRALDATLERFPSAPRRFVWRDPHAQAADLAWTWEQYAADGTPSEALEGRAGGAMVSAPARSAPARAKRAGAATGAVTDALPPAVTAAAVPLFAAPPAPDADAPGMGRADVGTTDVGASDAGTSGTGTTGAASVNPLQDLLFTPVVTSAEPDALSPTQEDPHAPAHDPRPSHAHPRPASEDRDVVVPAFRAQPRQAA